MSHWLARDQGGLPGGRDRGQPWETCRMWTGRQGVRERAFSGECECQGSEVGMSQGAWCWGSREEEAGFQAPAGNLLLILPEQR